MCGLLRCISICHDVIPSTDQKTGKMVYESQSPDETALVMAANSNNSMLLNRNKSSIEIQLLGKHEKYDIVRVLNFNSTRKRMSVIIKSGERYVLYCKGADNVINERLAKDTTLNDPGIMEMSFKKLEDFSEVGLRVLMLSWKPISTKEFEEFTRILTAAEDSLEDREEKVMQAYETIEKDLIFIGCTAIEDKLQDDLSETIKYLLKVIILS